MDRKKINDIDKRLFADLEFRINKNQNCAEDKLDFDKLLELRSIYNQLFLMKANEEEEIKRQKMWSEHNEEEEKSKPK